MDVKGSPEVSCCCQEIRMEPDEMPPEYDTRVIEGTAWVNRPYSKWLKERPPIQLEEPFHWVDSPETARNRGIHRHESW